MPEEPYVGQIVPLAFPWVPVGWAFCDGAELKIREYQPLYALIGTTYGGNGTTHFKLPDLRGRVILGSTSDYPMGREGGSTDVSLDVAHLPVHDHVLQVATQGSGTSSVTNPNNKYFAPGTEMIYRPPGPGYTPLASGTK